MSDMCSLLLVLVQAPFLWLYFAITGRDYHDRYGNVNLQQTAEGIYGGVDATTSQNTFASRTSKMSAEEKQERSEVYLEAKDEDGTLFAMLAFHHPGLSPLVDETVVRSNDRIKLESLEVLCGTEHVPPRAKLKLKIDDIMPPDSDKRAATNRDEGTALSSDDSSDADVPIATEVKLRVVAPIGIGEFVQLSPVTAKKSPFLSLARSKQSHRKNVQVLCCECVP